MKDEDKNPLGIFFDCRERQIRDFPTIYNVHETFFSDILVKLSWPH